MGRNWYKTSSACRNDGGYHRPDEVDHRCNCMLREGHFHSTYSSDQEHHCTCGQTWTSGSRYTPFPAPDEESTAPEPAAVDTDPVEPVPEAVSAAAVATYISGLLTPLSEDMAHFNVPTHLQATLDQIMFELHFRYGAPDPSIGAEVGS
ncbi:MAG TPA: hypothetical protein VF867_11590 [Arthrobacter sp.]